MRLFTLAASVFASAALHAQVEIVHLNIGQGESPLLLAPPDTNSYRTSVLIDAGGTFDYINGGDTIGRRYGSENAEVEAAIADYLVAQSIHLDVLRVNHHGGNNATTDVFLTRTVPEIAVISAGNGISHCHPHRSDLGHLANHVNHIVQTEWGTTRYYRPISRDIRSKQAIFQGEIIIATDGNRFDVSTRRTFDTDGS